VSCGAAISTLLFRMATDRDLWAAWSGWFPTALQPVFHDLSITLRHLHEAAAGADPLGDPESDFAYPRAILLLRHLGLHHAPAEWLGLLQGLILTLGVVIVLRPLTPRRALGTSLLLFTPPILLGFERGNLDFPIFLLCAAAAWQWSRSAGLRNLVWPIAAATAGALLKLYPVFAMCGAALAETGRRRLMWLVGIALVTAYWHFNYAELCLVVSKVPVATGGAWGCLVFFARLERYVTADPAAFGWLAQVNWLVVAVIAYAVSVVAAAVAGFRLADRFDSTRANSTEWTHYWVGALICCGSFVAVNFAYRWVFVLMAIPLLLRCVRSPERAVALWSRATMAAVLLSLAAPLKSAGVMFALIQAVNWGCVMLLIVGCTAFRVTPKSRIFAFLLRLFAKKPTAARECVS
jgi:hypothetical protein